MPLQGKKPFQRLKPPSDLHLDEKLFYCKITHEVFREYEQFFDRVILCNSLVWTCSLTGKPGLTFQEALESEKNARFVIKRFPEPLKRPLLYLASLTQRGRLNDMCDDVYAFVKERYFLREVVEVTLNGIKKLCEVTKVISPEKETKSPAKQEGKINKKVISPEKLKYEVKEKEHGKTAVVKSHCISRPKSVYTKANNKLFLRHHTVSSHGVFVVKDAAVAKYDLENFNFKDVSAGPAPKYTASPTKKKALATAPPPPVVSAEKKKRIPNGTTEPTASGKKVVQGKINFKKDAESRIKQLEREQLEFEKHRQLLEEQRARRREELKRRIEEDREKQRALKMKEREQKKEEKKKLAEYMNSWKKPRDDLECDDLKDLPKPSAVDCSIPQSCFGDAMVVLQFLGTFSSLVKVKEFFPQGFTFDHLEKALLETDIQGYFNDLIQMLLISLFRIMESEEEKVVTKKMLNMPDLKSVTSLDDAEDVATAFSMWPQLYQGIALQNMPLDSFSITEILRLHILSSGSERSTTYTLGLAGNSEDPGLQFKLDERELVEKLASTSVFQLNCEERLKILNLLIQQLACTDIFRSHIEESVEKSRQLYLELRQLRRNHSQKKKDDGNMKNKKEDKNSEEQSADTAGDGNEDAKSTSEEGEKQPESEKQTKDEARLKSEFLRKEREIKAKIYQLKSSYQTTPIGYDRAHRKYWMFSLLPGIFVEDNPENIGPCLLKETPQAPANASANRSEGPASIKKFFQHLNESKNGSSDKENDILQDLAIIQNDYSIPLKGRKLSDLNTRVDTKKSISDSNSQETCLQCKEKKSEYEGSMPMYCPHMKTSSVYGLCTASIDTCPVHNLNAPRTPWSFFYKQEDFEALLSSLNPRGFREGSLRDYFVLHKEVLLESMARCPYNALNQTLPLPAIPEVRKSMRNLTSRKSDFANMKPEVALELTLRDMIVELEHRIYAGGLGSLKVENREAWKQKVEENIFGADYDHIPEMKPTERAERESRVVKELASALLNVSECIETRFLQPPLSANANGKIPTTRLQLWQESLVQCTSLSQLFVHLGTLERSVAWSRSVLKAHCRICRRRGDGENMLLCDGCNRGHHLYCLKPPLEKIPEGDWFCMSCKPPEKVVAAKQRVNYREASEEESEGWDESDADEEEGSSDENDESEPEMEEDGGENGVAEMADEVCETCGGPGTVICCDRCPKVYHPECIGLRRIPRGEWLCPSCTKKMEMVKKTERHSPTGKYTTRAQSLLDKAKITVKPATRTKIQINAAKRKSSDTDIEQASKKAKEDKKDDDAENPFKKVYRNSAENIVRRRSKSSGVTDMLDYKTCLDLLVELMHHPSGWPFLVPVSKKDAPGYHLIINRPMDFATIRSKLNNMIYKNNDEFVRDIFLVLQNCEMFNPCWTAEYKAARVLHKVVLQLLHDYNVLHSVPTNSASYQI